MDEIIKYFTEEKNETIVVAKVLTKKLMKYDDIRDGFINWIRTRDYSVSPEVGGYTAASIHEMQPRLDGSGVYQFLVTLRDNPDVAQEIIDSNFSTK